MLIRPDGGQSTYGTVMEVNVQWCSKEFCEITCGLCCWTSLLGCWSSNEEGTFMDLATLSLLCSCCCCVVPDFTCQSKCGPWAVLRRRLFSQVRWWIFVFISRCSGPSQTAKDACSARNPVTCANQTFSDSQLLAFSTWTPQRCVLCQTETVFFPCGRQDATADGCDLP